MRSFRSFVLLFFSFISNVLFILIFLRNTNSPIFISGNLKVLLFNIFLAIIILSFRKFPIFKFMGIIDLKNFSFYDIFSSIFISLLSGTIFWSLGPTIIDRSLSVNILGTLYLAREPLSMEDINWSLYENYMNGKFQTKKRIEEQLFLGNIKVIDDDKFILTKKGFKAAQANIWITRYFNLDSSSSSPKRSPINNDF